MENKTDKQLVWESVKAIESITAEYHPTFAMLPDDIWKDYPKEDRFRIRGLLLSNGLASVLNNQHWAFQLTAAGMVLKESDLNDDGTLKPKKDKQYWKGVTTVLIGAVIGAVLSTGLSALLEVWKTTHLLLPQTNTVVLPKIQLVHDTVWMTTRLTKKR
jgi:hypothetical protein